MTRSNMNSRSTTRRPGKHRGAANCRSPRWMARSSNMPATKVITESGTLSPAFAPKRRVLHKPREKRGENNAHETSRYFGCTRPHAGRRARLGASCVFRGIRCQQTPHVEGNTHEVGNDQSAFVV